MVLLLPFLIYFAGCKKNNPTNNPPVNNDTIPTIVKSDVAFWMTKPDKSVLFKEQTNAGLVFSSSPNGYSTINVDTTTTYQSIDGFGFALTGASAELINYLSESNKEALLQELFLTDSTNIGVSYLRISLGASDLSSAPFTYDEVYPGQTDTTLQNFSIDKEKKDLIPILQKIIALDPSIKIIATPWTAPIWMKTNDSYEGGSLKPQYYGVYAKYFVKYIQAMKAEGINITAITPQNEPLNAYNNPAMLMTSAEEDNFVKNYLGPAFKANNINTKIIIYDHNLDHPEYAISILSDTAASKYIDGSAFHLYAGDINTMSTVHNAFPNKNLYFTEQATFSTGNFGGDLDWHVQNLIIGAIRNWSKNVIEWNLASDPTQSLHTAGGCSSCLGALTISTNSGVTRNVSYYIIAQAAKFVRPGSVRIGSNNVDDLQDVAFKTPDGKKVLIVLNGGSYTSTFNIAFDGKTVTPTLSAGAVGTFIWK
ncbi:MAG: glucosylceramidase [Bacteroidales bacterium]|nr:glucosylceramidase [Bacteroidales bacterium]